MLSEIFQSVYIYIDISRQPEHDRAMQVWYPMDKGEEDISENTPTARPIKVLRKTPSEVSFGRHLPKISTVSHDGTLRRGVFRRDRS